jgi:hypothetical protein
LKLFRHDEKRETIQNKPFLRTTIMGAMDDTQATRRRKQLLSVSNGGVDSPVRKKNSTKSKKKRKRRGEEPPFWQLFLQVALTLLLICLATYHAYRYFWPYEEIPVYQDDDNVGGNSGDPQREEIELSDLMKERAETEPPQPKTPPPLPTFELSESSKYDVFGIIDLLDTDATNHPDFWMAVSGLKERFAESYGGENAARMLLDKGLSTFGKPGEEEGAIPSDVLHTACRMKDAKESNRPFAIAFGGYSVTVGRGNYYSQSFPFVMERLMKTLFGIAGVELSVRNAAIGGCPAFPYGWCLSNFLGESPDVISWDYSMNEAGGGPEGMEAYVRHALTLPRRPKLLVKDTHMATQRRNLLGSYENLLKDPVVIHTDPAVKPFLNREEAHRPEGFQEWRKFGAPPGAPGQALHHPAVKEHELIGWLLAMHFGTALQVLVAKQDLECPVPEQELLLPRPFSRKLLNTTLEYSSVLFGESHTEEAWSMNPVHCRTTFKPILTGDLKSIVYSGTTGEDIDIMLPKSQMFYNKAWTLDLSEGEKSAQRKLNTFHHGLGFLDRKDAYYGIYTSGRMKFLVPYEAAATAAHPKVGEVAIDWFQSLIICQVNEKRDSGICNGAEDLGYAVGGVNATNITMMGDAGTLFLGKKICAAITIPKDATFTSRRMLEGQQRREEEQKLGENQIAAIPENEPPLADQIGLLVEVFVTNQHIVHVNQACSVSHVIWEHRKKSSTSATLRQ